MAGAVTTREASRKGPTTGPELELELEFGLLDCSYWICDSLHEPVYNLLS